MRVTMPSARDNAGRFVPRARQGTQRYRQTREVASFDDGVKMGREIIQRLHIPYTRGR